MFLMAFKELVNLFPQNAPFSNPVPTARPVCLKIQWNEFYEWKEENLLEQVYIWGAK